MTPVLRRISTDTWAMVFILLAGPLVLALFPAIPFANNGNCDPWYIFGMYYHYSDMLHWIPSSRQAARVPEILPGYFLSHVLNGRSADYALFLFYYIPSLFFFYKIGRLILSPVAGLSATIAFATHPLILANYATTLDAPSITYNIICLYFVVIAITARSARRSLALMFVAGLALGVTLHAYLGMAAFAFANYVTYGFHEFFYGQGPVLRRAAKVGVAALLTILGVVAATLAIGAVLVAFGGSLAQVMNQVWAIPMVSRNVATLFWKQRWYLEGPIVGLLLFAGGVAVLNLANAWLVHRRRRDGPTASLLASFSVGVVSLIIVQLAYNSLGGVFVQYDYFYCFFVPYISLLAFSPFAYCRPPEIFQLHRGAALILLASIAAIMVAVDDVPALYDRPANAVVPAALAICALTAYLVPTALPRRARTSMLAYVTMVLLLTLVVRPIQIGAQVWSKPLQRVWQTAKYYDRVRQGLKFLETLKFADRPRFWIDMDYDAPEELTAFARSYLFCAYRRFPVPPPPVGTPQEPSFRVGDDVVVISKFADLPAMALAAFENAGLSVSEVARTTVSGDGKSYQMLVEHVTAENLPSALPPWTPEPPPDAVSIAEVFGTPNGPGLIGTPDHTLPIDIRTPPKRWNYGAVLPIKRLDLRGPLWIEIDARVSEGEAGFGVETRGGHDFLVRKSFRPSAGMTRIILPIEHPNLLGDFVVESWDTDQAARVTIERIAVLKPRAPH